MKISHIGSVEYNTNFCDHQSNAEHWIFSDILKIAKIKPLLKKCDSKSFDNNRPISLSPSISKDFE